MEFAEFLKKESYLDHHHGINAIRTIDLGEWSFEKIEQNIEYFLGLNSAETARKKKTLFNRLRKHSKKSLFSFNDLFEICVNCLGEIEVTNRIWEKRKKQWYWKLEKL